MPLTRSRYDGHADWYDSWNQPHAERNASAVRDLLGAGDGLCLDLGCGSGHYFDVLASTGRTVIGLDRSAGQLRLAAYDEERRPATAAIAASNRSGGPEGVIDAIEALAPDGFDDIDAVLPHGERERIVRGYAKTSGFAAPAPANPGQQRDKKQ
jgi:SAM-dependent methyltransferase